MPVKAYGKNSKPARQKYNAGSGVGAGQKWCTVRKATTHSDAECDVQGAPRLQTNSTHTAVVVRTRIHPENNSVEHFDGKFGKAFIF